MNTLQSRLAELFPEPQARGLKAEIATLCGVKASSVSNWFGNPEKVATISRENAEKLIAHFGLKVAPAWLAEGKLPKHAGDVVPAPAPAPHEAPGDGPGAPPDLVIAQYDTGGAMGNGFALEENPPGLIKSWRVDGEWLRLNVPHYSSFHNLCIVTGFGPSMKPRYNPGDPLLCDRGVTEVDSDGVYFFRVDGHGFIKQLQRIPTREGMVLRAKSFNPDYDPFEILPGMDFQVFGKILTVWRSEQF